MMGARAKVLKWKNPFPLRTIKLPPTLVLTFPLCPLLCIDLVLEK